MIGGARGAPGSGSAFEALLGLLLSDRLADKSLPQLTRDTAGDRSRLDSRIWRPEPGGNNAARACESITSRWRKTATAAPGDERLIETKR
jgi:hypothetical protein